MKKNNDTIAPNVLHVERFTNKISVVYKSKYNNKCKKQVILLMICDGIKYHYLPVPNLSGLLHGNSSNHRGGFYCLNCFNSYTTKNKLKEHEEICNNHDSFRIEMPAWVNKTIKYNPEEKSLKAPFTIYLDLESILKKVQSCQNNPKKSYTEKVVRHEPSGWSMFKKCLFNEKENKLNHYRGKDRVGILCKKSRETIMEIIDYKKRDIIPLTQEENNRYNEQEICYICKEKFCVDKDDKYYINRKNVEDYCHYIGEFKRPAHSICNLKYKVPKEIPIIIHNATYDTHFIINQLAIEFKGELNCIGNNMENYITFLYHLRKNLIMVKQLHTNLNLLIVLNLCQLHYQNLLITRLKFLKAKNVIMHRKNED